MIDIKTAKTSELVAFYNANVPEGKVIKKFADRATAEKRVAALIAALEALATPSNESEIPEPTPAQKVIAKEQSDAVKVIKVHKARESVKKPTPTQAELDAMSDEEYEAMVKSSLNKEESKVGPARTYANHSASIALSWNDPEVAAKRLTRNGVKVDGHGDFKSVREAFAALNLPDSKHIRFRMKLKEAKTAIFEWAGKSYTFHIA